MRIRIQQIQVPLAYTDAIILNRASRKLGCKPAAVADLAIVRRSLDARARHAEPVYVLTVDVTLSTAPWGDAAPPHGLEVIVPSPPDVPLPRVTMDAGRLRPVVVGAGPAGLMAAYQLAKAGVRPLLIDRGEDAAARTPKVAQFWNRGVLDPESNVLYGEGGAGLFSDGKLTARSKARGRIRDFMELLHACGADGSVVIDSDPHVGSDRLMEIVPRLRERIIAAGAEVQFQSRLDDILVERGELRGVVVNGREMACRHCVLAVGHSARDVHALLARRGVALEAKPFAMGVRLEVPQDAIDRSQYGRYAGHALLGPASFRLTHHESSGVRSCYSFCMCPGGRVISCASEPEMLTTNGMSYAKRSLTYGNAAFLVPVQPGDYPAKENSALAGMEFQRTVERKAFARAGGAYGVGACLLTDFLARRVSTSLPEGRSCPRSTPVEIREILPEFVTHTLEKAIPLMIDELRGINVDQAILYAPETRSSSPLWMLRNTEGESINTRGLYPAGEGAGYAGGIVSSAIDGMRAAEHVIANMAEVGL